MESNVRDEREVCNSQFAAYKPLLLGQHAVEDAEDPQDLLLVPLDRAWDSFRVEANEPERLSEVRATKGVSASASVSRRQYQADAPLTGGLEEQPLDKLELLVQVLDAQLVLLVIFFDEVQKNRVRFPAVALRSATSNR